MEYENIVLTIISDPILMYDIAQSNNIGDGSLAKINVFVVTHHFSLWVPTMIPTLFSSCILLMELNASVTSAGLQNKPIVD